MNKQGTINLPEPPYIPCFGLTNEQVYELIKITQGKMHLLLHPDQLAYVKKRLEISNENRPSNSSDSCW